MSYAEDWSLKNLLGRFDAEAVPENTIGQNFFVCSELSGVEALFEKAARNSMAGIALIADKNNVYGLGIALEKRRSILYSCRRASVRRISL